MSSGESMGTKGPGKRPRKGEEVGRGDSVGPAGESVGKEGANGLVGSRYLRGLERGRRSLWGWCSSALLGEAGALLENAVPGY